MKTNDAPEKIYLQEPTKVRTEKKYDNDVEYIRTDAFIEKALKFLDGCIPDYIELIHANVDTFINVDNKRFIDEFKKYIKGK